MLGLFDNLSLSLDALSRAFIVTQMGLGSSSAGFGESMLLAAFEEVRKYSLTVGIGVLATGILMFFNHKRRIDSILAAKTDDRIKRFETRKFRRRSVISSMVASVGCMLAALYWVTDGKVYSMFILMILALLLGVLGIALIDLFSVGLHQIGTPDQTAQKKMIEEYLRQREKLDSKDDD